MELDKFTGGAPWKHMTLGLLIREILSPWTGHPYDFEIWTRLGFYMQSLASPYTKLSYLPGISFSTFPTTGSIGYPPLSAFGFALAYRLYVLLGEPTRFLYYFLLKQPMIFADIGVAILIAKIILLTGDVRLARTGLLVWLYFPLGIIISSMWGQLDPIALFLSLLAAYFFLNSRFLPSAFAIGLSIYLKALPLVFLPVFLIQSSLKTGDRVVYCLVSLGIPIAGTLIPALIFNWSFQGIYSNLSFQAAIPGSGEMSLLGIFYSMPSLSGLGQYLTPIIWVPALFSAYVYIRRRSLGLLQGLLIAILAFTISRPFLSEQYAIYPVAFLLAGNWKRNIWPFLGLTFGATLFLVANYPLLVTFFSPLIPGALQWDRFTWQIFIITQPLNAALRSAMMTLAALVYFTESLLVLLGKESIVYRVALATRFPWPTRKSMIPSVRLDVT